MAITTIPSIVFTDGSTGKADLTIAYEKVLKNLRADWWGIHALANAEGGDFTPNGSVVYTTGEGVTSKEYTAANRNDEPDLTGQTTQTINIDQLRIARWEIETMDRARLQNASQLESLIATHISNTIMAEMDGVFFKLIYDYVNADPANRSILNPTFETATSDGELKGNYYNVLDAASDIEGIIDRKTLGTRRAEVMVLAGLKGYGRLISAVGNMGGGNAATEIFRTGTTEGNLIGGLNIVKHGLIGKNIAQGVLTQDKAFDLEKFKAYILNTFAIAMPMALKKGSLTVNIDPNSGNPKFVMKWAYGVGIIRQNLIKAIRQA